MTRKTLKLYTAVWNRILELAPNLKTNLTELMSDFESAIQNSVINTILRPIKILGCWFHYYQVIIKLIFFLKSFLVLSNLTKRLHFLIQALLRRWRKLRLCTLKATEDVLWLCMNLALAPSTKFQEGLLLIQKIHENQITQFPKITTFLEYVRKQWLTKASLLCELENQSRTNNAV